MSSPSSETSSGVDSPAVQSSTMRTRRQRETTAIFSTDNPLFAELARLYADNNPANGEQNTTEVLCSMNSDGNYVIGCANNNEQVISYSALKFGKLVLIDEEMLERVAQQEPQQCLDIMQKLSKAGCKLAEEKMDPLLHLVSLVEEDAPVGKKKRSRKGGKGKGELGPNTTDNNGDTKKRKVGKGNNTPKQDGKGDEKLPSANVTDLNKSVEKRKIIRDTKQPSAATTTPKSSDVLPAVTASKPRPCDKDDTKLSSAAAATKPTPKSNGNLPTLPFGSGDGDDFAAAVGGGGGASKPQPKQQQKASIAGAKASGGSAVASSKTTNTKSDDDAVAAVAVTVASKASGAKASGGEVAGAGGDGSAKGDGGQKLTEKQQKDLKSAQDMKKALANALGQDDQFKTIVLTKEDCLLGDMGHARVADKAILRAKDGLDVFAKHYVVIAESSTTEAAQQERKCILAKEVGWYFFYDHFMENEEDAKKWLGVTKDDVFRNQVIDNYWKYIDAGRKERAASE